jgi:hypothetical protein
MESKTRWGWSSKKQGLWFYKKLPTSRSMCWSWTEEDLEEHFGHNDFTNLEYLEGLNRLKEKLR